MIISMIQKTLKLLLMSFKFQITIDSARKFDDCWNYNICQYIIGVKKIEW